MRSLRRFSSRTAGRPAGSIIAHVPARALDAQDVGLLAVQIAHAGLDRGVAAAMQHELRIAAEQARRVDAQARDRPACPRRRNAHARLARRDRPTRFSSLVSAVAARGISARDAVRPTLGSARFDHQPRRRGFAASSLRTGLRLDGAGGGRGGRRREARPRSTLESRAPARARWSGGVARHSASVRGRRVRKRLGGRASSRGGMGSVRGFLGSAMTLAMTRRRRRRARSVSAAAIRNACADIAIALAVPPVAASAAPSAAAALAVAVVLAVAVTACFRRCARCAPACVGAPSSCSP